MRRLARVLSNNFGLKLLALGFAIILWLLVVNVEDPDKTRLFTVPVKIENEDFLTSMGKTYEILDETDTVTFTVVGKRSIVDKLTESDFTATANTESIDEAFSLIPITINASRYSSQIQISKRSSFVKVSVENLISAEFDIAVETTGEPFANCFISSVVANPKKVVVTGPESVIGTIEKAAVYADVSNATEDVVTSGSITLLDIYGNEISQNRLTLNRDVADIDISILMRKQINIELDITGEPAEEYRVTNTTIEPNPVTVVGDYNVLNAIDSVKLTSPVLNISGATQSVSASIRLTDFLPDEVMVEDAESESINVNIEIIGKVSREYEVPAANISINNLGDGLSASINSATVVVTVTDFKSELDKIMASDITGEIDAAELSAGTHTCNIVLNGDIASKATASTEITIANGTNEEEDEMTP